jgi:hypothetical protein
MAKVDAFIFDKMGETMLVGTREIKGIFYKQYQEVDFGNGTIVGFDISFHTRYSEVSALAENDEVDIRDDATGETERYLFRRHVPKTGDETGRVICELGRPLP